MVLWEAFYGNSKTGIKYAAKGLRESLENNNNLGKCTFLRVMAVNLYFEGSPSKAEELLKKSIKIAKLIGSSIHTFYGYLWLSLIYHKNNMAKFENSFRKALVISKEEGYNYIFLRPTLFGMRDPNSFIPILLEGKKLNIEVDYINKLLDKINLKERCKAPGYGLKIKSFGILKLYRGRVEIKSEEWTRRKAKELFKLLLVNSGSMIHRNKICSQLWPSKDKDSSENNFYVTLNTLTNILEPDRNGNHESYFIKSDGSYYGLTNTFTYDYDADLFEQFVQKGSLASDKLIKINYYQRAVDLYKDDYIFDCLHLNFVNQERNRLKVKFLNVSKELLFYYYESKSYKKCIEIANKILNVDNYFEDAYFYKMKSYYKQCLRNFAIETYQEYKNILENDLKINPADKLKEYYNLITN